MAKRRTDDWQIDEWDESLDAAASVRKDPSAPVTSENWNVADLRKKRTAHGNGSP